MRRLAVIDLVTGDQPISGEDGDISVVQNGEIYNHVDLRRDLESRGHRFTTNSDTEVLVHGYEEYGPKFVLRLRGMFAIAVLDKKNGALFLARDRFGEKPLYYVESPDGLVFASEISSLLEWPGIDRTLDLEALAYYLRIGVVPEPLTMFQSIRTLTAGCWYKWTRGVGEVTRYFSPHYEPDPALNDSSQAVEAVRESLATAVKRQMISDVPLGAFLSGGIDSSAVTAALQSASSTPIKTFNVRFEDSEYDESPIARAVARHLGTDHHELTVGDAEFVAEDLDRIVEHVGQPFADSSAIPTYLVSKFAREYVTVSLTGDGGDEMFAGYDVFSWARTLDRIASVPRPIIYGGHLFVRGFASLPLVRDRSFTRKIRRGLEVSLRSASERFADMHALVTEPELAQIIESHALHEAADLGAHRFWDLPPESESWTPLRRRMYARLRHQLPGDMLIKTDRMSMAVGLELRCPMLDPDLAELSMKLPDSMLMNDGVGKWVLREAVRDQLPEIVFDHPKKGFSLPLHRFQNDEYRAVAFDLLNDRSGPIGLLKREAVTRILDAGLSRKRDNATSSVYRASHQLWALVQLAAWGRRFGVSV